MRRFLGLFLLSALLSAGCSGDEGASPEGGAEMETTEHGTKIISSVDRETGLRLEIQDNSLYLKLPEEPVGKAAELRGTGLGGACDVSSEAPFSMPELFPIYWREDFNDWGSALTRGLPVPDDSEPTLAEFVTECRLYAPPEGSDEIRLDNLVTTIRVR